MAATSTLEAVVPHNSNVARLLLQCATDRDELGLPVHP